MIGTLEDAWRWYEAVKELVGMMDRMGRRYWNEDTENLTLRDVLHKDNQFRTVEAETIRDFVQLVEEDLDDLVVLLLFSVFEANVRQKTLDEIQEEIESPPRHLVLKKAVADAREAVEHGSFGRLTESYKELDPNVKTQVDQVRRYRNWVAHGRRGLIKNNVDPQSALARLEQFLRLLDANPPMPPIDPVTADPNSPGKD